MEIVFENFGKSLLILIWIICGIIGIVRDPSVMLIPAVASLVYLLVNGGA